MFRRGAAVLLALAVVASCSGDDKQSDASDKVTISFWVNWEGDDAKALQKVIDRFEATHENIQVDMTEAVSDTGKLLAAIQGGTAPDAVATYDQSSIGKLCSTGAFEDLGDRIDEAGIDDEQFAEGIRGAGTFEGTQCALPYLGDAFALYYNQAMFDAAGITKAPTTLSELATVAKKLTKYNADGSIAVAGFVPIVNFYEQYIVRYAPLTGAKYFDDAGKAALSQDAGWKGFFEWQDQLIEDLGGYDKLTKFTATSGDEFTPQNPFETGKIAMVMDGEWRTRFLQEEVPDLQYGTAPFPVLDGRPELLGASLLGPEVMGLPKGGKHQKEAFELIRYLTTDTDAIVSFANAIHNVPSTVAALESPDLDLGDNFQVFLDAFNHPYSGSAPIIEQGTAYFDPITSFAEKWQAGSVDDLGKGLQGVDEEIDQVIARG